MDLGDLALDAHQVADVLVRHRGLRCDELRLERGDVVGDDLDAAVVIAAEVQLDLAAVVGHAAVDADLHALGIVARDREDVDAACVVLHIDAVEERGVLVIAGGIGRDGALDREFFLLRSLVNIRDLRDGLGGLQGVEDVAQDEAVGIILIALDVVVAEERHAGGDDPAAAGQILVGHDIDVALLDGHAAVDGLVVLRHEGAAVKVAVVVRAPGALVAAHEDLHLALVEDLDRAAVVELEAGLVVRRGGGAEGVRGRVGARGERMPGVEVLLGGEVETVGLVRLQVIVDDDAVDNAGVCTDGGEQGVGVLGAVVILVVAVGLGAEDDLAAVVRVLLQRGDLGLGVHCGLGRVAAVRDRQNEEGIVLQVVIGELTGLDVAALHAVVGAEADEVAGASGIVAGEIVVVVAVVDADVDEVGCVIDLELQRCGTLEFLALIGAGVEHAQGLRTGGGGLEREGERLLLVRSQRLGRGLGLDGRRRAARRDGQLDLADLVVRGGRVRDGGGDGLRGADRAQGGAVLQVRRDGCGLADPHRSGHGDVAVGLRDLQVVVRLGVRQLGVELIGRAGDLERLDGDAVRADDLDLAQLLAVGVGDARLDADGVELLTVLERDDAAHEGVVQIVVDREVLVLGGVDAALSHGGVEAGLREVVGHDDVAAGVGVAPLALVVILVVRRRDMPAL